MKKVPKKTPAPITIRSDNPAFVMDLLDRIEAARPGAPVIVEDPGPIIITVPSLPGETLNAIRESVRALYKDSSRLRPVLLVESDPPAPFYSTRTP